MVALRIAVALTLCGGAHGEVLAAGAQATAGGAIAGVVTRSTDSQPAAGARIIVVPGVSLVTTTDETGSFSIANVPAGTYTVYVQRDRLSAPRQQVRVVDGEVARVAFVLSEHMVNEEITVTATAVGTASAFESFNSIKSLDSAELAQRRGASIAESLATVPGVATRSFGSSITRPIIRGFDGDRVLIMEDGMRTGSCSAGQPRTHAAGVQSHQHDVPFAHIVHQGPGARDGARRTTDLHRQCLLRTAL
jgi:iron complex outermembrane recepter protein